MFAELKLTILKDLGNRMKDSQIYGIIKSLFPMPGDENLLSKYIETFQTSIEHKSEQLIARLPGVTNEAEYSRLVEKYSKLPKSCPNPIDKCNQLVSDLFVGFPIWRSPLLQYNVAAPVNVAAAAMYSLALDNNIFSISDSFAGNTLVAEEATVQILGNMIGIKNAKGWFTFSGSATILYGIKVGLKKADPESARKGITKSVSIISTEDGHFATTYSAEWLGIGTDNVERIKANANRTSSLTDLEQLLRTRMENGIRIAAIVVNGGTSYGHVIDDIKTIVELRDALVKEYKLEYSPHIHVDSVIGWMWLFFHNYDFKQNELGITDEALELIQLQYQKISELTYADSWGADFHKSIGGCPADSSVFILNDQNDAIHLSKKEDPVESMHQIAEEFATNSPVIYTLENSRSSGPPLAALTSLHSMGSIGFQRNLANLIETKLTMKRLFLKHPDISICDPYELGYVLMIRMYPPLIKNNELKGQELSSNSPHLFSFVEETNIYLLDFFNWDRKYRMDSSGEIEYSFSTSFVLLPTGQGLYALKIYPNSPHTNEIYAKDTVSTILNSKNTFDAIIRR